MDTCNILESIGIAGDYIVKTIVGLLTSWPFIVFLIFFALKKHIVGMLKKIREDLRVKDNKFSLGDSNQPDIQNSTQDKLFDIPATTSDKKLKKRKAEYDLPELPDTDLKAYTLEIENKLKKDLAESPYKKIDIMVRDSTNYRIATEFERIYRIIFGSQIRLLRHLEAAKTLTKNEVAKFFKQEKRKMPDSNIESEPWTKFVQSQGLMEYKDGEYTITNKGLAFIAYLALFNYEDRLW